MKNQADPVAWLQRELRAEFQQNSEILTVRLAAPANRAAQAQILLAAVISAYLQSVTAAERQQILSHLQQQADYDLLCAEIVELSKQIGNLRNERGVDDLEAKLLQLEADRAIDQAGKLKADLGLGKMQASGPPRARLIQPPVLLK